MQNDIISYTQHTDEVVARGAGDATRAGVPTGEPVHGSVSAGVQKAVRARESRGDSAQASGRSMIEMLGVLAIIGVLSVGALSGYRMAMTKYRANEIVDYLMRVGEAAAHHGYTQKTGILPARGDDKCKDYVNGEEAPFDTNCYIAAAGNVVLVLGAGSFSTELGTAIQKQVGTCSNGRSPCVRYVAGSCSDDASPSTYGQPCIRFELKI